MNNDCYDHVDSICNHSRAHRCSAHARDRRRCSQPIWVHPVVPEGFPYGGSLEAGDILVSNFNSSAGVQGTGTTIVKIAPNGTLTTFFQGQPPLGFTTALGVLRGGFVLVGNVPTINDGATAEQGSLLVIDRFGHLVTTLTNATFLDGPWDLAVNDLGVSPRSSFRMYSTEQLLA
jgi:hypothetical protein